ncbi:MAG: transposase [Polyangiaceae bacterium]
MSRVIVTVKGAFDAWKRRSLTELDVVYMYLDAIVLKVRSAKKVVSMVVVDGLFVVVAAQPAAPIDAPARRRGRGHLSAGSSPPRGRWSPPRR